MNDSFAWWLVIAGLAIGVALGWLILGRLPREDADVSSSERAAEAEWISRNIAQYGGEAPEDLVEEILDLHRHYLGGPPVRAALDPDEPPDQAWTDGPPAREPSTPPSGDRLLVERRP